MNTKISKKDRFSAVKKIGKVAHSIECMSKRLQRKQKEKLIICIEQALKKVANALNENQDQHSSKQISKNVTAKAREHGCFSKEAKDKKLKKMSKNIAFS